MPLRVCYMGLTHPDFSRSGVYRTALRERGVVVYDCFTQNTGVRRFFDLFYMHWQVRHSYDVLIVAYPGYILVGFAWFITRKPIIFDALCTLWEAETLSHAAGRVRQWRARLIDWVAVQCASVVLVESRAQQQFFLSRFNGPPEKFIVLYTSVSETWSQFRETYAKRFQAGIVVFRGKLTYESGIATFVRAAQLMEGSRLRFRIIGSGYKLSEVRALVSGGKSTNIELISEQLSDSALRKSMAESWVSVGQLSDNERLRRTIPHKAYESMVLGLPYITVQADAVAEIFKDGISAHFIPPNDPAALADALRKLMRDPLYAESLQKNAKDFFDAHVSQRVVGEHLFEIVRRNRRIR